LRRLLVTDIGNRIKGFIAEEIMFEDSPTDLSDDTQLLGGILDSLGLMQLVSFIEEEFDVTVEDSEVTVDNFRTVNDIERMVTSKVNV
jgi:D-alanine--poly(phosphoribitol) ligase subunit 2